MLRNRDAFPGEDVAKVPVNQLAQAKAESDGFELVWDRWHCFQAVCAHKINENHPKMRRLAPKRPLFAYYLHMFCPAALCSKHPASKAS